MYKNKIYVFVFLGEFGYELLNWQGVIRKFSRNVGTSERIVVASRKGVSLLYDTVDSFIDISSIELFNNSIASGYGLNNPDIKLYSDYDKYCNHRFLSEIYSIKNYKYIQTLKNIIKENIGRRLVELFGEKNKIIYVFSDHTVTLNGLQFGRKHRDKHDIYYNLDVNNNEYTKLKADETKKKLVEQKLGMSLSEKYILCQTGSREIVQRSKDVMDINDIIKTLNNRVSIVLLEFNTGRKMDSGSCFNDALYLRRYMCDSLEEQSVLIAYASKCLFFTEGDFRSHNYLPPFFGKDVFAVANKSVFDLPTTPIDYWNEKVFKFGGQIYPIYSERLIDKHSIELFCERLIG